MKFQALKAASDCIPIHHEHHRYKSREQNYNIVATRYPNSAKASRAVYQLYSIAKEVDKNTALANQYKTKLLTQFPQSEEAKFIQKK